MFSGFYLALFLILAALIVRGVAFEFRSKDQSPRWRATWDWMLFVRQPAARAPVGRRAREPVAGASRSTRRSATSAASSTCCRRTRSIAGLASLSLFVTHGAIFLHLKSTDPIRARSLAAIKKIGPAATVLLLLFVIGTYAWTDVYARLGVNPGLVPLAALGALVSAGYLIHRERMGWAFVMTTLAIVCAVATLFIALFPRVMVSSLDPAWSLTIYNASSTPYTLKIMSIVAGVFVPVVLVYQGFTYWVFRHRITAETKLEY